MTKKIITCGILSTLAVVVSSLEKFVPIGFIIPLPGVKLGIANCIVLFSLIKLDLTCSLSIMFCKSFIVSILFSNPVSFIYSFTGGLFSVVGMFILLKFDRFFSIIGVSIAGAVLFNVGQIFASSVVMNSIFIYKYLSFLLPVSLITGFLIGLITIVLLNNLKFRWG